MKEYTVGEIKSLIESMNGMYDMARVVDPIECRVLEFGEDGRMRMSQSCYSIWNAEQKCINCTSAMACRTGCHQEKAESFSDKVFHIQSNPVKLRLPDGGNYEAVVELVSIEENAAHPEEANDRAAENVDHLADRYQALHDALTNALYAGAFYEFAREKIVENPGLSWAMITANIKDFRLINTLFGVLKGNEVLVRTADCLNQIARMASGLCGRLGNDQFVLLLPQEKYREEALLHTAQTLSEAFSTGLYTFHIHYGVYRMEDSSIPVSVMCDRANSALRTIRGDMRKTVAYFDESMMRKSLFEQEIISGFDDALKSGQFKMYLQPLAGKDGTVFGAEALARWQRPDGTVIQPESFVETLERAGLVHRLDMFMWESAVKQLSAWKGTDKQRLTISVNMSAKDFYSLDVYKVLTDLTEKNGVDSNMLRMEITETALLKDPEKSGEVVSKLREKGFCVEIDDFGKGYSALSLLKNIEADVLKIDMSLVSEIENKKRSRTILASVINMAKSLGMDVITEGVETEAQLQSLSRMGCAHFQGYYFSRPIPVEEFEKRFSDYSILCLNH